MNYRDLNTTIRMFDRFQQEEEHLLRLHRPSYQRHIADEVQRINRMFNDSGLRIHEEIRRLSGQRHRESIIDQLLRQLGEVRSNLGEVSGTELTVDQIQRELELTLVKMGLEVSDSALSSAIADATRALEPFHPQWQEICQTAEASAETLTRLITDEAKESLRLLEQASSLTIDWNALDGLVECSGPSSTFEAFEDSFDEMLNALDDLYATPASLAEAVAMNPPRLATLPASEYLRCVQSTKLLADTPWQDAESHYPPTADDVPKLIEVPPANEDSASELAPNQRFARIHPALPRLLAGATAAARSSNPDRGRHVASSLREAITTALHQLAPTDAVLAWNSDKALLHEGRPTRRARYLFVFRSVELEELSICLRADAKNVVSLVEVVNSLVHSAEVQVSEMAMDLVIARVVGFLDALLAVTPNSPW